MQIADFELERYFARWEFKARFLLCSSDVEALRLDELLALADPEAERLWRELKLSYTETTGHPLLRAEIARLYERVAPEEVLVVAGAQEGIFLLANVLLGPGDHAVVSWPAYQSLYEVARAAGAEVTLHELREDRGWAIDPDELRRQVRPGTKLVVLNVPHNPTGMLADRATFDAVVAIAREAGAHLLVDEVYRGLEAEAAALPTGADAYERGVSLGVMSKSFALPGLRIGWLASKDRGLLARCAAFKDYTTICSAGPSELLALIGLRAREKILARSRRIVERNLALLDPFFERQRERLSWVRPRGGSIGFPRLTAEGVRLHGSADRLADELVEREGVLLLPGSRFGHPGEHVRLGFGRENLPEALERLERFLGAV